MRFAGTAGNGQAYINAALSAGGKIDSVLAKSAPKFDTLSAMADKVKAQDMISGMSAQANVANAGIASIGATKSAAFEAEGIKAAGEAAASATEAQGLGNMFSGLAGGIGGLFGGGGSGAGAGAFGIGKASTSGFGNYPSINTGLASTGANAIGMTYR